MAIILASMQVDGRIAAMTGHFAAGGMVLSLNSDLRVGLAGTKGGITEAKLGRGSPWAVPMLWLLPQPLLMELTLTGELLEVERFHALGFVNYVEPTPDAVRQRACQLAARIRDNAPLIVSHLAGIIAAINREGMTIVLVEQNARLALRLSRYGYVFETGRLALQGPSSELLNNPYVTDIYLGGAPRAAERNARRKGRRDRPAVQFPRVRGVWIL